ncbi:glutamate ABC transporter substrate-binding protein [Streptomyces sp. NPDC050418]|uniref:glutamate ABC transporter substrate-binding protein n=1 Tax=Streptomyces sp. NPDC050418 TaxID=3365612 RepID=UPI003798B617
MAKASRLRGWGGVGAMALACVCTAVFTLLPLRHASDKPDLGGQGVAHASPARAADCNPDEVSLRPGGGGAEPTIAAIKAKKKLVVGIDQNSYRWGYRNPNTGDLEGFDIDLAKRIAAEILDDPDTSKVVFRAVPTQERINAINDNQVDMVVRTMTITCDRAKEVDFSSAYFKTSQQILVPEGSKIKGFDSLKGHKVCVASGSTAFEALKAQRHSADDTVTVANQLDCLVRLQLDEAEAVVTDGALAAGQAAQDPTVKVLPDTLDPEYYGVAMKKGSEDLVRRVNKVLEDYREDGWQQSYDKWLAAGLGEAGPPAAKYKD